MNTRVLGLLVVFAAIVGLQAGPAWSAGKHHKHRKVASTEKAAKPSPQNLEERHQVCLAFIKRQNLSCDPWQTPTCGAGGLYARPLECVAP